MTGYWQEQGGVIVDNIAKYAAACHAAGREVMDDDDAQFEARMRLDALYASISRALDLAEARGAQRERERCVGLLRQAALGTDGPEGFYALERAADALAVQP